LLSSPVGAQVSGGAVAVHMAREGADIAVVYLEEADDAAETAKFVEAEGRRCLTISGDVSKEDFCKKAVSKIIEEFGHLDVPPVPSAKPD
jgi:NAD(P)-dependent dehydrogenase (short-subunit alcohol dehydrogenase family)